MRTFTTIVAGAMTLAAVAGLAACSSTPTAGPTPRPCDALTGMEPTTPTVALLAQTGDPLAAFLPDVPTILAGAEAESARVIVSGVGDDSTPTLLTNVRLVGTGSNPLERDNDLECKQKLVSGSLAELQGLGTTSGTAVFAALMTLAGNLEGSEPGAPVDVVLLTSTVNTTEPADLSDPAQLADPVGVLNRLAAAGMMPDCSGWRFHAVGVGTQPLLREFWRHYAERCGGALVAWTSRLAEFPGSGIALDAADTDQLAVEVSGGVVTAGLSADVLFDGNSSVLSDEAVPSLEQLLALVQSTPGRVTVTGHTDVNGEPGPSQTLSESRGGSVAQWLIEKGVSVDRIVVDGRGGTDPVYPSPQTDEEHGANRRVVVTIGGE